MEYEELERRLTRLGESVADRLTPDQARWHQEFLSAGEYALALEMLADWLSEEPHTITGEERLEAEVLATAMGNAERVMRPLALCPERP